MSDAFSRVAYDSVPMDTSTSGAVSSRWYRPTAHGPTTDVRNYGGMRNLQSLADPGQIRHLALGKAGHGVHQDGAGQPRLQTVGFLR